MKLSSLRTYADDPARPTLPPGGGPMTDEDFMRWCRDFCMRVNVRWCDRHFPGELPRAELLTPWRLLYHLHKFLVGWGFPEGQGPSRAHRIRFVAVQYALRPEQVRAEARRYARELYEEARRG